MPSSGKDVAALVAEKLADAGSPGPRDPYRICACSVPSLHRSPLMRESRAASPIPGRPAQPSQGEKELSSKYCNHGNGKGRFAIAQLPALALIKYVLQMNQ
ncbi:hypothetical protein DSO57_1038914 [Entomophthora muscae]|uniref:Uncharacterized protein n=1 Tax=Entomophthora muscae TaxID=34485 RepID=A0ACC2U7K2_9FUNG|nr:hypothetical protein DSO57_1038914 [Entomophthora muscae]